MALEKNYSISGEFLEKKLSKKFTKQLSAISEKMAAEKLLSTMGSKHNIPRRHIAILEIREETAKGEK